MKYSKDEKLNIGFIALLALTVVALLFAACKKHKQVEQLQVLHDMRGYTQDTSPMTVGMEAQGFIGDGIALYRVIQSSAANIYSGDFVLQSVVSGHVLGSALLYSNGGYRVIPQGIADIYKLNYAATQQSNHIRGYKLPVWSWPVDETCVTFTPGTDDGDIVIDDERKITRPLPCPRACD